MLEFAGIFYQQDVAEAGSYPVIEEIVRTAFTSASTTHNADMPTTVNAGDLILVVFGSDGSATVTASGFTSVFTGANGSAVRLSVFAKVAVGNEDGTTVNFQTSASELAGAMCYRITNWGGSIANDIVTGATGVSATAVTQNPPSLTSGFGAVHVKWFAIGAVSGAPNTTGYPSGYPSGYDVAPLATGIAGALGDTTAGAAVSCWKDSMNASEDPGVYTFAASTVGIMNTMALRGT